MPSIPVVPLPGLAPADPSPIASTGLSPVLMTGLLVSLLRQHFAEGEAFNPLLRGLCWTPDPANPGKSAADSAILIESSTGWNPDLAGTRPALVVGAAEWTFVKLGINNEVMGRFGPGGEVLYANQALCSNRILAIGSTEAGDEGGHLGYEAVQFLNPALPYVREAFSPQLAEIGVAGMGPASNTIEEAQSHPAVPVTVAYKVLQTWAVLANKPKIGRLVIELTTTPT